MLRLLLRLALLASAVYCADHNLYRDCSRIDFCSRFRHQDLSSEDQFSAQISDLQQNDNVLTIPLSNSRGQQLNLQISFIDGNKVRAKVLERDHNRYELVDVLEKEPQTASYSVDSQSDDSLTVTSGSSKVIVKRGAPFVVEFYNNNDLQVTLDGSRLIIENTDSSQAFGFDVYFEGSQKLYGLHHHATKLTLAQTADGSMDPFRLKNSDTAGYEVGSPMALYGAKPVVYGHSSTKTSGVFLHNAAQQWVDISYQNNDRPSAHFMAESGTLDIFVMLGPSLKEVVRQLTDLTGKAHMPQLWTLGYHQSRYSYQSQDEVKDVISKMDEGDFPMDAIWLDIDYTDGKKYFTWNPGSYSDPKGMQETIASTNRKLVTILDPHIKIDDDYAVYTEAKNKYFVKSADGNDFQGDCWPGTSSYIDFLSPAARDYWASWYSYDKFVGSTETLAGTWNDMNEPSVFNAYDNENSLPHDALHEGNVQHRDVMNIYGFLQSKASHQGLLQRDDGKKRPFVLSRSHFVGSQRYTSIWSGDNRAEWPYLPISYSECMLSNILGHVFCGADIGGFEGNPGDALLQRWYQAAVWLPFFRGHSNNNVNRREPYQFYESMRDVIRKAIKTRYRYIPVFYTLFYQHARYGDPIVRPLFYEYPDMVDIDDHILVGSDILGTPVMNQDAYSVDVHFPGDSSVCWFRADLDDDWSVHSGGSTETIQADLDISPVFYRAGSIIVLKNTVRRSTTDMISDSYTVYVNVDNNGKAEGLLYGDDYTSFEYANNNQYYLLKLSYGSNGDSLQVEKLEGDMDYSGSFQDVIYHRVSSTDSTKLERVVYNTTSDGTLLRDIDYGKLLENNGRKITLQF